jgi:hypothetical protein
MALKLGATLRRSLLQAFFGMLNGLGNTLGKTNSGAGLRIAFYNSQPPNIAVLPLHNPSGDSTLMYDGFTSAEMTWTDTGTNVFPLTATATMASARPANGVTTTISWFRIYAVSADGVFADVANEVIVQGTVGMSGSGADMILENTAISAASSLLIRITNFSFKLNKIAPSGVIPASPESECNRFNTALTIQMLRFLLMGDCDITFGGAAPARISLYKGPAPDSADSPATGTLFARQSQNLPGYGTEAGPWVSSASSYFYEEVTSPFAVVNGIQRLPFDDLANATVAELSASYMRIEFGNPVGSLVFQLQKAASGAESWNLAYGISAGIVGGMTVSNGTLVWL